MSHVVHVRAWMNEMRRIQLRLFGGLWWVTGLLNEILEVELGTE
jgi:hypothetical protein